MDYIAQGPDVNGQYTIYTPQVIADIESKPVTLLNKVETYGEENLQDKIAGLQKEIDNIQAMLDAISSCKGGADVAAQYSTIVALKRPIEETPVEEIVP
jgi:hypothetical protein